MTRLSDIPRHNYLPTAELRRNFGKIHEPCEACGCCVFAVLHTGEVACGDCGPSGRKASRAEVAYWAIVVVEDDGRHVLVDLDEERQRRKAERFGNIGQEVDLGGHHGRWRCGDGCWRRVG